MIIQSRTTDTHCCSNIFIGVAEVMEQIHLLDVEYIAGTTRLAGVFCREKGRRRGRWVGYQILKQQEKVIDDIEESAGRHP
jgi:hypothetical protein